MDKAIPSTKFFQTLIGELILGSLAWEALYIGEIQIATVCIGIIGGLVLGSNGMKTLQNYLLRDTEEVK